MSKTVPLKTNIEQQDMDQLILLAKRSERDVSSYVRGVLLDHIYGFARRWEPIEYVSDEPLTPERRTQIYFMRAGVCAICSVNLPLNGDWHIDHFKPRIEGGTNAESNLRLVCSACNQKKWANIS